MQDYTDGNNWSTTIDDVDIDYVTFTTSQLKENSIKIPLNPAEQLAVDVVVDAAQKQARKFAETIDAHISGVMTAGVTGAANIDSYGTSANYIEPNGDITEGTAGNVGAGIHSVIRFMRRRLGIRNVTSAAAGAPTNVWLAMPYVIFDAWEGWLESNNYSGQLSYDIVRNGMIARYGGNMDIVVSNDIAVEVVSTKDQNVLIAGTNEATTFAERPSIFQLLPPAGQNANQAGPWWKINALRRYQALVENSVPLVKGRIRAEA